MIYDYLPANSRTKISFDDILVQLIRLCQKLGAINWILASSFNIIC